jgi:hypothetical protein
MTTSKTGIHDNVPVHQEKFNERLDRKRNSLPVALIPEWISSAASTTHGAIPGI